MPLEQTFQAVVQQAPIGRGLYVLKSDSGEVYEPINLPSAYRQDGLRVEVRVRLRPDMMSVHMIGILVEMLSIQEGLPNSAPETDPLPHGEPRRMAVFPVNAQTVAITKDDAPYFDLSVGGWGPGWSYFQFEGEVQEEDRAFRAVNRGRLGEAEVTLVMAAVQHDDTHLDFSFELRTTRDVSLTMMMVAIDFATTPFRDGLVLAQTVSNEHLSATIPLGPQGVGQEIVECEWIDGAGERTRLLLDTPSELASDGQIRIVLARDHVKTDEPVRMSFRMALPAHARFYASPAAVPMEAGHDAWYPFLAGSDTARASEIDMSDWLEKPAGKHGRIVRHEDRLLYNGAPIQLWGLNLNYNACSPEKTLAERRAAFYAKYGINAVRLHKYADGAGWAGIQSKDSFVELDPEGLDRMDYFVDQLKRSGIYVKLSSTFGVIIGPDDFERIPYWAEFGELRNNRVRAGAGSIFLSKELQDMQIEQVVRLLRHKNPYTKMTYAEDPAVAVVELLNEESALFFNTMHALQRVPTLRARAGTAFTQWLKQRYGSEEALRKAWGPDALNSFTEEGFTGESWERETIIPAGNPWFYDPDQLNGSQAFRRVRLLDTMLFYYEWQNAFYARYVKAIRETGYEGEILASNWQAGRAMSHYFNLHSDWLVGLIDRHNYFGGRRASRINAASMLDAPGSGMLSAGMQQVSDRPFMLSEWIHRTPTEWGVEGPALIGAYGMGLQGWDVSFIFQNEDDGQFGTEVLGRHWRDVMTPHVWGVFPAVSRQVLRGDVREASEQAVRYVHLPALHEGRIGFDDTVGQEGDVKTFTSEQVPAAALAAVRCVVTFTDTDRETPAFDLTPYRKDGGITSSTSELFWREAKGRHKGYFTINTPGTKAVVGFAEGETCLLGEVSIEPRSRFAAIYVTALGPDDDIESADRVLITAIARTRNTGTKILHDEYLLEPGHAPLRLEPVRAGISLRRVPRAVYLLDHDGVRTTATIPVRNGTFEINGARDRTPYYLAVF